LSGIPSSNGQRAQCANPEACGLTILVAEDDASVRKLVGHVLRSCGHMVLEAADGAAALEVAEQHSGPIHLLVTDWCMPRLNGGELIRRLKDERPGTAILIMSGYIDSESPLKAKLLRKPFNGQDLVESVNGVIQGDQ
jgi:two-component system, cell cycle sensor histidine kinase and response regulator CckA